MSIARGGRLQAAGLDDWTVRKHSLKLLPASGPIAAGPRRLDGGAVLVLLSIPLMLACATPVPPAMPDSVRPFEFPRDGFAFANELISDYAVDEEGRLRPRRRVEPVDFGQRCVMMSRAARQFHVYAEFVPDLPVADEDRYRDLIAEVFNANPRRKKPVRDRIQIPGYPDLHSFSKDHEALFKQALNYRWLAYFQRGNWRMIFPFLREQQNATAERLARNLHEGRLAVVHVVRFPDVEINHTVLLFAVEETSEEILFTFYDPNGIDRSRVLVYGRAGRTFYYPKSFYFSGGPVRAYEVYRNAVY